MTDYVKRLEAVAEAMARGICRERCDLMAEPPRDQ